MADNPPSAEFVAERDLPAGCGAPARGTSAATAGPRPPGARFHRTTHEKPTSSDRARDLWIFFAPAAAAPRGASRLVLRPYQRDDADDVIGGDDTAPGLDLKGPGAVSVKSNLPHTANVILSQPVKLAPGKSHTLSANLTAAR